MVILRAGKGGQYQATFAHNLLGIFYTDMSMVRFSQTQNQLSFAGKTGSALSKIWPVFIGLEIGYHQQAVWTRADQNLAMGLSLTEQCVPN